MKKLIKSATSLTCLLLAAAVFCLLFASCAKGKVDFPKLEHNFLHFYSSKDTMTHFYRDAEKLPDTIAGNITRLSSVDGTNGFVIAATALYHIDGEGLLKIYPAAVTNAVLSLNGRFILFSTATRVFLYDHEAKDYVQLDLGDIDVKNIVSLVLSPDGGTAGVSVCDSGDAFTSFIYKNGELTPFGAERVVCAVSDGAKIVYWLDTDSGAVTGRLHGSLNGKETLIAENASPYFEVNRTLDEITFDVDEKTHISRNTGKAKQLADASVFSYTGAQYATQGGDGCKTLLKNTNTLLDSIFYTNIKAQDQSGTTYEQYNVYYVNSALNVSKLVLGATQFAVSNDGKEIACIVDDSLYRVSAYSPKRPVFLASNVYSFTSNGDLDKIYLIDLAGNLHCVENGEISPIIVTGVELVKQMDNGTLICYASQESNGTLLWVKDDRSNAIATNVSFFEVYPEVAVYLSNLDVKTGEYDLYTSSDGVTFEFGLSNVGIK